LFVVLTAPGLSAFKSSEAEANESSEELPSPALKKLFSAPSVFFGGFRRSLLSSSSSSNSEVIPDLIGFGLLRGGDLTSLAGLGEGLLADAPDTALAFCSKRFTRDVVGKMGVVSVGLSLSAFPWLPESLLGLGATAGRAAGGDGRAREAAKNAACCEADLLWEGAAC
jgi:hypothetical protein